MFSYNHLRYLKFSYNNLGKMASGHASYTVVDVKKYSTAVLNRIIEYNQMDSFMKNDLECLIVSVVSVNDRKRRKLSKLRKATAAKKMKTEPKFSKPEVGVKQGDEDEEFDEQNTSCGSDDSLLNVSFERQSDDPPDIEGKVPVTERKKLAYNFKNRFAVIAEFDEIQKTFFAKQGLQLLKIPETEWGTYHVEMLS